MERDNQNLLQYFIVHNPTEAEEEDLKSMPLFVAHGSMNEQRLKAAELYAPNKDVEELGYPVLSWKDEWSKKSKEGNQQFAHLLVLTSLFISQAFIQIRPSQIPRSIGPFEEGL
jgi:hypothetical protein